MNQKSTLITVLLAIAVLILGIAYAVLSAQTLTVNGTATVTTSSTNFDVEFVDEAKNATYQAAYGTSTDYEGASFVANPTSIEASATISSSDEDKMILSVSNMTTKGDEVTFELPIINSTPAEADVDALLAITLNSLEEGNDWFKTTASLDKTTALVPGEVATLTVAVELLKTPISQDDVDAINAEDGTLNKFTVELSATPQ